jgi:DNA polymerase-4
MPRPRPAHANAATFGARSTARVSDGSLPRAILHVDMDAFYASVEQRDDPSLRGRPLIVGGHPKRGVVLAASYEVRPFGVRSAMPMSHAVRRCPHAVVVRPRFDAYVRASEGVHAVFERYTPLIEPLSLDEAFLDVTASRSLFGDGITIARRIREEIRAEVGLPASAGVASVKFLAKMASDLAKPDGIKVVPAGEERAFLAGLPVGRLWGVGPRTEARLHAMGLRRIGDIAGRDRDSLAAVLGEHAARMHALAQGVDPREVVPDRHAKSVGAEDTFGDDLSALDALDVHIHAQSQRVARRLRRAGLDAGAVVLKLKTDTFELFTRRAVLPAPTDDAQALFQCARTLLRKAPLPGPLRLTGVSTQDLRPHAEQPRLFDPEAKKRERLNAAWDKIHDRFGRASLRTGDQHDATERVSTGPVRHREK